MSSFHLTGFKVTYDKNILNYPWVLRATPPLHHMPKRKEEVVVTIKDRNLHQLTGNGQVEKTTTYISKENTLLASKIKILGEKQQNIELELNTMKEKLNQQEDQIQEMKQKYENVHEALRRTKFHSDAEHIDSPQVAQCQEPQSPTPEIQG
ncbi:unnamed protein product [Darwinula stevensoni]|uniref:Uncharacterized protein n=1 Tax=Darwinula stevensoni TaxID=69355 RepID=A0A7R8XM00_9CRUS|nr:unnamed protein product [Darwinula stevensoni]CAG0894926.1 unnamed protein product [Darwinula stevensoni]